MYAKLFFCSLIACLFLMEKASAAASAVTRSSAAWPLGIAERLANAASRQPILFYSTDVIQADKADCKAVAGAGSDFSKACSQEGLECRKCLEGPRLSAAAIKSAFCVPCVAPLRQCRSRLIPFERIGGMDAGMRLPSPRDDPPLDAG